MPDRLATFYLIKNYQFTDNLFTKVTIKLIKLRTLCIIGNSKRYSIEDAANSACDEEIRSMINKPKQFFSVCLGGAIAFSGEKKLEKQQDCHV